MGEIGKLTWQKVVHIWDYVRIVKTAFTLIGIATRNVTFKKNI